MSVTIYMKINRTKSVQFRHHKLFTVVRPSVILALNLLYIFPAVIKFVCGPHWTQITSLLYSDRILKEIWYSFVNKFENLLCR